MFSTLESWFQWLYDSSIGVYIRESTYLFPSIECVHVLSIVIFVGSITMFDLKLLNLVSKERSIADVHEEIIPWARWSFVFAAIAGLFLFSSNAINYVKNFEFQMKILFVFLGGINMMIFEIWTSKRMKQWAISSRVPRTAMLAGGVSIIVWILTVGFGRWVGFTMD